MNGRFGANPLVWENRSNWVSSVFHFAIDKTDTAPSLPGNVECSFFASPSEKASSGCLHTQTQMSVTELRTCLTECNGEAWENALLTVRVNGDGPMFN